MNTPSAPLFSSSAEIELFQRSVGTRALGKHVSFFERAASTNDLALDAGRNGAPHGSIFVAESQDSGRGRRGRTWECPPGKGLLFSVLVRPLPMPPPLAGWIPLLAGLACAQACAEIHPRCRAATIKWPNDLVLPCDAIPGWKKLGGILCESVLNAQSADVSEAHESFAVIGVGLNVNQAPEELPEFAKAPAASLFMRAGAQLDRRVLLRMLLQKMELNLDGFSAAVSMSQTQLAVRDHMGDLFGTCRLLLSAPASGAPDARQHSGFFEGLDEFGRLLILEDGQVRAFSDAEITALEKK